MVDLPSRCDVVVLGAGPVGLASAWYAAKRGFSVVVLDRAAQVGGLAGSFVVDGQSVDHGSHRLHPSIAPDVLADLRVELGIDLQWRPRHGRIRLQGHWLTFPLSARDLALHAPKWLAAHVAVDTAAAPIRRWRDRHSPAPTTFADASRRGLGPTITDAFYEPYAQKLWALPGRQLSADLFRRRVSAGSSAAIVRKAFRRPADRSGFWYPTEGFGTICDALADGCTANGAIVAVDTSPAAVSTTSTCARVELADGRSIVANSVISTIPARALLGLLGAPDAVRGAAEQLEFRGAVLVYLTVPSRAYTPFDAHYFPEPSTIVSRLSEPKRYRRSALDPADHTVLCAEVPASVGDETWGADDHVLVRRVEQELVEQGLPDPRRTGWHVTRRTHVYPVYHLGYAADQHVIREHLDAVPHLAVVGRQGVFAHDNTHHALLMGKTLAHSLEAGGRIDTVTWRELRRAFDDHVVED